MLPVLNDTGECPGPEDDYEQEHATIIDLGLAHLKAEPRRSQPDNAPTETPRSSNVDVVEGHPEQPASPSCHSKSSNIGGPFFVCLMLTLCQGTLPFIAYDLVYQLETGVRPGAAIEHELHHDVESVFWVLVYFCMKYHGNVRPTLVQTALERLCSPDVNVVRGRKVDILLNYPDRLLDIGGDFGELGSFLKEFADYFNHRRRDGQVIEAPYVPEMAVKHRDSMRKTLQEGKVDRPSSVEEPQTPPPKSTGTVSSKRKHSGIEKRPLSDVDEAQDLVSEEEDPGTPTKKRKPNSGKPLLLPMSGRDLSRAGLDS